MNNADLRHSWFLNGYCWLTVLNFASMNVSSYIWHFSLLPCRLQDVAGYGVALAVKDIYADAFGERNLDSNLVDLMVKDGRQGILLNLLLLISQFGLILYDGTNQSRWMHILYIFPEKWNFQITVLQERRMVKVTTFMRRAGSQSQTLVLSMWLRSTESRQTQCLVER